MAAVRRGALPFEPAHPLEGDHSAENLISVSDPDISKRRSAEIDQPAWWCGYCGEGLFDANDAAVADLEFARIKSAADKEEKVQLPDRDSTREAAKLRALRAAADAGIAAIERGECRTFDSIDDFIVHLDKVAQEAIENRTARLSDSQGDHTRGVATTYGQANLHGLWP